MRKFPAYEDRDFASISVRRRVKHALKALSLIEGTPISSLVATLADERVRQHIAKGARPELFTTGGANV